MLNGFKQYVNSPEIEELARLERGHWVILHPTTREQAWTFIKRRRGLGRTGLDSELGSMAHLNKLAQDNEAIIIALIPKRWFKGMKNFDVLRKVDEMLPLADVGDYQIPNNYIWGVFSQGSFTKNPNYHGHDSLYNAWRQKSPRTQKQPLPLEKAPRVGPFGH